MENLFEMIAGAVKPMNGRGDTNSAIKQRERCSEANRHGRTRSKYSNEITEYERIRIKYSSEITEYQTKQNSYKGGRIKQDQIKTLQSSEITEYQTKQSTHKGGRVKQDQIKTLQSSKITEYERIKMIYNHHARQKKHSAKIKNRQIKRNIKSINI